VFFFVCLRLYSKKRARKLAISRLECLVEKVITIYIYIHIFIYGSGQPPLVRTCSSSANMLPPIFMRAMRLAPAIFCVHTPPKPKPYVSCVPRHTFSFFFIGVLPVPPPRLASMNKQHPSPTLSRRQPDALQTGTPGILPPPGVPARLLYLPHNAHVRNARQSSIAFMLLLLLVMGGLVVVVHWLLGP